MSISREDVIHVAHLARLEIPEDEIDRVREELGAILEAVGKVSELDLDDVEPTSHPARRRERAAARTSRGRRCPREEALRNAPDPADGAFRVPAVG